MSANQSRVGSIGSLKGKVKKPGQKAEFNPVMEALTRLGYGVRGLIYITMGVLAFKVALGKGGAPANQQGAIAVIGQQPAGMVLLWVVLIGLVSYSLWGVIRAISDPLHKGSDLKGLLARAGYLFSAASYAILILPTYGYITGAGRTAQSTGQTQQTLVSIMSHPWGHGAVGVVGLVVIVVGLVQIFQGIKSSFDKQFETYAMTAREVRWANQLGRFGTATRGFILVLLSGSLLAAAYQSNSSQSIGIDTALATLLRQPYGIWLLAIVAVGLMVFGVYSLLSAAWFRNKR